VEYNLGRPRLEMRAVLRGALHQQRARSRRVDVGLMADFVEAWMDGMAVVDAERMNANNNNNNNKLL
jgi:hypothetical protein